jgi:hypothetical protein
MIAAALLHGVRRVLMLALRIAIAWTAVSLLCLALWVLLIELALRRRARQAPRPLGTSTQTLSEKEVEALLATPAANTPIGADGTSRRVREPKVAQMQKASRVARPRPRGIRKNPH